MSTTTPTPSARPRYVTIGFVAAELQITPRTVRTHIGKGFYPAYRIPGTRGVRLNIDEVHRAMKLIPASRSHAGLASFGPNANIIDLPPQPVRAEVIMPEGEANS
jgi:hypothetical protein